MSIWQEIERIEAEAERLELEEIERVERWLERHRHKHHPRHATHFLFPGLSSTNLKGQTIMASQGISLNTPFTGALIFKDPSGNVTNGPTTGTLTLDNPANGTATLSANGQSINVTATALPIAITYAGTNDAGVALTGPVLNLTLADVAATFDFGPLTPGTTA